jgi:branched-chain amino acid transport system ATP-binding protein
MLEISDLAVSYDSVKAVQGVSLTVTDKECIALVGGNGAGKSTTLKAICGLVQSTSGNITLNGVHLATIPPPKRVELGIVYVPEGRRVFPEMTVFENLEIGAFCQRARAVKDESLEMVFSLFPQLKVRARQRGSTLSGGEQQMLAIGRGLMARPNLLMLDEPSLGLAPVIVDEVYNNLKEIKKRDVAILLVEEDIFRAFSLADRAYVLENGKVVLDGKRKDLLNNDYVKAAYMGSGC